MSDIYNGGITLNIGDYTLKKISSYDFSFELITDSFETYDYNLVTVPKGQRFKASVSTQLYPAEALKLKNALFAREFHFVSPDFSGMVQLTAFNETLTGANFTGRTYNISFAVSAVAVTGGSGWL